MEPSKEDVLRVILFAREWGSLEQEFPDEAAKRRRYQLLQDLVIKEEGNAAAIIDLLKRFCSTIEEAEHEMQTDAEGEPSEEEGPPEATPELVPMTEAEVSWLIGPR
jgi:hypothetical protein